MAQLRQQLRHARAHDPAFPASAGKHGTELLYRVGDLKRWAHSWPRAATSDASNVRSIGAKLTRAFQTSSLLQQLVKHDRRRRAAGWPGVS
ncbi:hypothetical protein ACFYWU_42230 [Streptomyces chrestomyceticus]|uniref:hypothetical protein n=1 Tax=Streptomyces chrestomyceticus TaxID=68185 RepID=UPI0036CE60B7